jgi:thioesterase domain-containing protein
MRQNILDWNCFIRIFSSGQRPSYVPGDYSGRITLFRATQQPPWIISDRTLGWQNLVKGGVQIYDTPGHHADLVRDPRARMLARQLEAALLEASI